MKPYIIKIKGTEAYLSSSNYFKTLSITKKELATVYRSLKNVCMDGIKSCEDFTTDDNDVIRMLDEIGIPYKKTVSGFASLVIPEDCIEMVTVEAPMERKDDDITGSWVIRIKGTDIYLHTSDSLTVEKEFARVWNNKKTDPIGKLSRGMELSGTANIGKYPSLEVKITLSQRSKKLINYILSNKELVKDIKHHTLKTDKMDMAECIEYAMANGWKLESVDVPVDFLEREKL